MQIHEKTRLVTCSEILGLASLQFPKEMLLAASCLAMMAGGVIYNISWFGWSIEEEELPMPWLRVAFLRLKNWVLKNITSMCSMKTKPVFPIGKTKAGSSAQT